MQAVQRRAHGIHGSLISDLFIASAHGFRRGNGGGLGYPHGFNCEIAVQYDHFGHYAPL